jgi:PncC family amidohydrolase
LAESCTGGLVSKTITDVPGSSDVFWGGLVVYSNEAKESLAGVPRETILIHGAVSEETVLALAKGLHEVSGCDLACAISGVAGPGGGSAEKPVGTVWIAVSAAGMRPEARKFLFRGGRGAVRRSSAREAMRMMEGLSRRRA